MRQQLQSQNMLKETRYYSNYTNLAQNSKVQATKSPPHEQITISFVGSMKENIEQLLSKLQCSQGNRSQIRYILLCYADKINKLRQQRDQYKQLLIAKDEQYSSKMQEESNQIGRLRLQVQVLQKQLQNQKYKAECCTCQQLYSNQYLSKISNNTNCNDYCCCCGDQEHSNNQVPDDAALSQVSNNKQQNHKMQTKEEEKLQSKDRLQQKEEELLISHNKQLSEKESLISQPHQEQQQRVKTISEEEMIRMMIKYNLGMEDFTEIINNYQNNQESQPKIQQACPKPQKKSSKVTKKSLHSNSKTR